MNSFNKIVSVVLLLAVLHSTIGVQVMWHTCHHHSHTDIELFAFVDDSTLHIEDSAERQTTQVTFCHGNCGNHQKSIVLRLKAQTIVSATKNVKQRIAHSLTLPCYVCALCCAKKQDPQALDYPTARCVNIPLSKHSLQQLLCVMTC